MIPEIIKQYAERIVHGGGGSTFVYGKDLGVLKAQMEEAKREYDLALAELAERQALENEVAEWLKQFDNTIPYVPEKDRTR